jgi:hypothetical protein
MTIERNHTLDALKALSIAFVLIWHLHKTRRLQLFSGK